MQPTLAQNLEDLQTTLQPPSGPGSAALTLSALMPCEPAVGPVAVAVWTGGDDGELIELVRLDDGERLCDTTALRESLTLLAMVETLEELASFDELATLATEAAAWGSDEALPEGFSHARLSALEALTQLASLAPGDSPRLARTQILDDLGAALRELERAWEQLEQQAELWSDAQFAANPDDASMVAAVQELWRILGAARRGPLAKPPGTALHEAREAGIALATAIAENTTAAAAEQPG